MRMSRQLLFFGLVFNALCVFCMEDPSVADLYANVHSHIDETYLGIDKNSAFKGIRGAILSVYCSLHLTYQQALNTMNEIDSYIPASSHKEHILKELYLNHWYVHFLMQDLIDERLKHFEQVKGSTIDSVLDKSNLNTAQKVVHDIARKEFFDRSRIHRSLAHVPMGWFSDIHLTALYGHKHYVDPFSLKISSDGKYLQSTDIKNDRITWDTEKGCVADHPEEITSGCVRLPDGGVIDFCDTCYAVSSNSGVGIGPNYMVNAGDIGKPGNIPIRIDKSKSSIILFKRPQEISYLCQQAFYNSKTIAELIALQSSNSINEIEGYPRDRLIERIKRRINELNDAASAAQ